MSYEHFLHFKNTYLKFSSSSSTTPTTRFDFTLLFGKLSNFSTQHSKWIKAFSTGIIIYSSCYYYFKHCKHMNDCKHQFPFFSYFYRVKKLFLRKKLLKKLFLKGKRVQTSLEAIVEIRKNLSANL